MPPSPATAYSLDESRGPFVGRERELDELRAAFDGVIGGLGRLFMLVGEPGIGKTRLAEQVAAHAMKRGALVLWGRSEEENASAYWPWIQVIRAGLRGLEPATLAARMGSSAVHLAPLVPELRELLPELSARSAPPADPDRARLHLFDAASSFLKSLVVTRPLVVVLDDLHAADRPSLLLLGLLARELRDEPVFLLGCYREAEVRRSAELSALLGDVGRHARRLPLRGISEVDVGRYIERTAGFVPPASTVAAVHRTTDGNPFFVEEVVCLLAADGRLARTAGGLPARLGIPAGVRDAIRRRLTPLQVESHEILAAAAVVGRTFDVACLERVAERPRGWILTVLDECLATGIVQEATESPGRYSFAHALIRETLYEDLPPTRRLDLHRRVGCALEDIYGADRDPHLPELAYHFFAAAPVGDAGKALEYCLAAAERACRLLACEEAIAHYDRALRTLAFVDISDVRRGEILVALGEAQDLAGDIEGAKVTFHRAAQIARTIQSGELLARAALGAGGQWAAKFTATPFDKSDVTLLEEGLGTLGPMDGALRAKLLARLSLSLAMTGRREQGLSLVAEAVDLARRLATPAVLDYALRVQHGCLLGPDHLVGRLLVSAELATMALATGDHELALRAQALRFLDLLEAGEGERAEAALQEHARLAAELRDPFDLWLSTMTHAMWAQLRGSLDECERLSEDALALARAAPGQQAAEENADSAEALQAFFCRRERGALEGFESEAVHWADRYVTIPGIRAIVAIIFVELGRESEARQQFERLAASDFAILPRDVWWLGVMPLVAQTAVALGDTSRAEILYDLMVPFDDRIAMTVSCASSGSMARYLGVLAAHLGRFDDARRHFELALVVNGRLGARGFYAHTQADYAAMLLTRDEASATREHARSLLREALATARDLGFVALADRILRLGARQKGGLTEHPRRKAQLGSPAADEYVFQLEGDYWTIAFAGTMVRLRTSKGLALLAVLLRQPGVPLRAVDLVTGDFTNEASRRAILSGDGGEIFDGRARRAYELRAEQLAEMLEQARSAGNGEHAAGATEELAFVAAELARGVGLGGRLRRAASNLERARVSATRALRTAIEKIADVHPALGRHLRVTIRTGTTCAYVPDPRLPATWRAERALDA